MSFKFITTHAIVRDADNRRIVIGVDDTSENGGFAVSNMSVAQARRLAAALLNACEAVRVGQETILCDNMQVAD